MLGNLVTQTAGSHHAELDVLHPVTRAAQRPDLPMSGRNALV
jgi:hypothetical protein